MPHFHLVRRLPGPGESSRREMVANRRIPSFAAGLRRRAVVRRFPVLAGLDGLSAHPLGGAAGVGRVLRTGLHADLHGDAELPVRCVRDVRGQRAVGVELLPEHLRRRAAAGGEAHVPPPRRRLGVQSDRVSEPGRVRHPVRLYPLGRLHPPEQQVLPASEGAEGGGAAGGAGGSLRAGYVWRPGKGAIVDARGEGP